MTAKEFKYGKEFQADFLSLTESVSSLPSYIRFTYHIVDLVDRGSSYPGADIEINKSDSAYQNVRLLRATMSNSEILLIALNCAYGAGYENFKPLIEKCAILHNISHLDIDAYGLREIFAPRAFGVEPQDRITLADTPPSEWIEAMHLDDAPNN